MSYTRGGWHTSNDPRPHLTVGAHNNATHLYTNGAAIGAHPTMAQITTEGVLGRFAVGNALGNQPGVFGR